MVGLKIPAVSSQWSLLPQINEQFELNMTQVLGS